MSSADKMAHTHTHPQWLHSQGLCHLQLGQVHPNCFQDIKKLLNFSNSSCLPQHFDLNSLWEKRYFITIQ